MTADLGDPLTAADFAYAESEEYRKELAKEVEHDEDGTIEDFEGDISLSQEDLRVLQERGIPGLREVPINTGLRCQILSEFGTKSGTIFLIETVLIHKNTKSKTRTKIWCFE